MAKIRVLVVEDSLTVRQRLCEVLASDPGIEVVGEAGDGKVAVELCRELRPDVITLDMILPVMSGLSATEYIMAYFPTPILIVSSSTNRGDLFKTYDALAAGALDVLEKPRGDESDGAWEKQFLATVKLVSRIKVITHLRGRLSSVTDFVPPPQRAPAATAKPAGPRHGYRAVALGASTGGPSALVRILRAIPSGLRVPIFVVLHIDEPFGAAFADWLDSETHHAVAPATGGEPLASLEGRVILAPPGRHLVVRDGRVELTRDPERHHCRPSIDVLFDSLAASMGRETLACLLTGMGRDGADGLLRIRAAGGTTIAQDEATSVVYGMPREAVLIDAAEQVLALEKIGPTIASLVRARTGVTS